MENNAEQAIPVVHIVEVQAEPPKQDEHPKMVEEPPKQEEPPKVVEEPPKPPRTLVQLRKDMVKHHYPRQMGYVCNNCETVNCVYDNQCMQCGSVNLKQL